MITHLSKEENRTIRRQLLTDIVYAISHDELTKIRPEHTQLTPVEIYLSARVFVKNLLELSDIDEGLDDEIRDLQDECMSENEAMVILVISSLILGVNNKKNPDEKLHNIILKIFQRTQGNELFMPLLKQFADKEAERIAQGKIILDKAKQASASASEEIRFRVEQLCLQIDYMRMMRYPKESKEDGTYDRVCSFARQHNIRLNEWTTVEEFIALYNKLMNGEITIEQITDFITKRWIEQAG